MVRKDIKCIDCCGQRGQQDRLLYMDGTSEKQLAVAKRESTRLDYCGQMGQ